jgi:hypothetical protein
MTIPHTPPWLAGCRLVARHLPPAGLRALAVALETRDQRVTHGETVRPTAAGRAAWCACPVGFALWQGLAPQVGGRVTGQHVEGMYELLARRLIADGELSGLIALVCWWDHANDVTLNNNRTQADRLAAWDELLAAVRAELAGRVGAKVA